MSLKCGSALWYINYDKYKHSEADYLVVGFVPDRMRGCRASDRFTFSK